MKNIEIREGKNSLTCDSKSYLFRKRKSTTHDQRMLMCGTMIRECCQIGEKALNRIYSCRRTFEMC